VFRASGNAIFTGFFLFSSYLPEPFQRQADDYELDWRMANPQANTFCINSPQPKGRQSPGKAKTENHPKSEKESVQEIGKQLPGRRSNPLMRLQDGDALPRIFRSEDIG